MKLLILTSLLFFTLSCSTQDKKEIKKEEIVQEDNQSVELFIPSLPKESSQTKAEVFLGEKNNLFFYFLIQSKGSFLIRIDKKDKSEPSTGIKEIILTLNRSKEIPITMYLSSINNHLYNGFYKLTSGKNKINILIKFANKEVANYEYTIDID